MSRIWPPDDHKNLIDMLTFELYDYEPYIFGTYIPKWFIKTQLPPLKSEEQIEYERKVMELHAYYAEEMRKLSLRKIEELEMLSRDYASKIRKTSKGKSHELVNRENS